ncbi:hypothetical protein Aduo_005978 [Ancylostoma duodenale]
MAKDVEAATVGDLKEASVTEAQSMRSVPFTRSPSKKRYRLALFPELVVEAVDAKGMEDMGNKRASEMAAAMISILEAVVEEKGVEDPKEVLATKRASWDITNTIANTTPVLKKVVEEVAVADPREVLAVERLSAKVSYMNSAQEEAVEEEAAEAQLEVVVTPRVSDKTEAMVTAPGEDVAETGVVTRKEVMGTSSHQEAAEAMAVDGEEQTVHSRSSASNGCTYLMTILMRLFFIFIVLVCDLS